MLVGQKEAEDMCKPAAATLRWHMLAPDLLGPPDVLNGSRSPAIIAIFLAAMVLFMGHISEPESKTLVVVLLSCKSRALLHARWSGATRVLSRETAVLMLPGLLCGLSLVLGPPLSLTAHSRYAHFLTGSSML